MPSETTGKKPTEETKYMPQFAVNFIEVSRCSREGVLYVMADTQDQAVEKACDDYAEIDWDYWSDGDLAEAECECMGAEEWNPS